MIAKWEPIFETRHFDRAYRKLGMDMSDFVPAGTGDNVWVSKDRRLRVRPFVTDRGHSRRLVEVRVLE